MKPVEDIVAAVAALVIVGIICVFTPDATVRVTAGILLGTEAVYFGWKAYKSWPR